MNRFGVGLYPKYHTIRHNALHNAGENICLFCNTVSDSLYKTIFSKVLQTFKALHRTRMTVFKDDDRALTGNIL